MWAMRWRFFADWDYITHVLQRNWLGEGVLVHLIWAIHLGSDGGKMRELGPAGVHLNV